MRFLKRLKPDHLALAALAMLALVFWGNCLWGGKVPVAAIYQKQMLPWSAVSQTGGETRQWDSLLWDSMAQFYPWRLLLHNAAKQGELPLWNPYQFCGYPFVGNGQSAIFYPPNWLYFVVAPKLGMGLSAALHYFLGSLFVFGLARKWRLGTLPAAFAALAFTYGGFMVTWIELPTLVNSLIWLPLAWWGIEVMCGSEGPSFSRPAVRGIIMLATALGMTLLAGHFQIAAYVWIFTAIYGLIRLVSVWTLDARTTRKLILGTTIAVVLGGMLATVQLLPTLELGRYSARGAGGPTAAGFEFHRQRALQPLELLTLLQADFLGTPVDGTYKGISYSEHCLFVGATTLLLGLIGLALGWRRKDDRLRLWLFFGIAVFALWGAMAGPPAMLLYWGVPKLGQAGGFPRLLSVWTLAAALWGGAGLQVLLDRLAVGTGPTVGRGLRAAPSPALVATAVAALALLLLATELLPWAHRSNPRADAASVYPETAAIRKLRETVGEDRYLAVTPRQAWTLLQVPTGALLPPNAATVYGLYAFDGYDSLFPAEYRNLAALLEGADPSPVSNGNMLLLSNSLAWPAHGVLTASDQQLDARHGWQQVWSGEGCSLYTNRVKGRGRGGLSWSKMMPWGRPRIAGFGPLRAVDERLNSCTATFDPPGRPAELLLTDTLYPGWQAWASGVPVAMQRSDAWRRVPLTGTERRVDMVYYPASVACGLFVSLLALAALTALGTAGLWRRRA